MTKHIYLPTFHSEQRRIWVDRGPRNLIRCGRRFGKTKQIVTIAGSAAASKKGLKVGIFAPEHKQWVEPYHELIGVLDPIKDTFNKSEGVIRTTTGGVIDFWRLNDNDLAGRGREYDVILIDEAAFTKDGSMINIWNMGIVPTMATKPGAEVFVYSTPKGVNPENFFHLCEHDPSMGFKLFHSPSTSNELVSKDWVEQERKRMHPDVFRQEILAEWVDWSGIAFFGIDKWLDDNSQPVEFPRVCDSVFAVIDSAVKAGSGNDGTGVTYYARNKVAGRPLVILDYDLIQIEGALLDTWLSGVMSNLEMYAKKCNSRGGIAGVWIEDKASGMVLLQQATRKKLPVKPIGGAWMQLGKDERALSVSSYHYQGLCKISRHAHDKVITYKGVTKNHLESQVGLFRMGDRESYKRADDLLDTYVHGLALTFGNSDMF